MLVDINYLAGVHSITTIITIRLLYISLWLYGTGIRANEDLCQDSSWLSLTYGFKTLRLKSY